MEKRRLRDIYFVVKKKDWKQYIYCFPEFCYARLFDAVLDVKEDEIVVSFEEMCKRISYDKLALEYSVYFINYN